MTYKGMTLGITSSVSAEEYKRFVEECEQIAKYNNTMEVMLAFETAALAFKKRTGRNLTMTENLIEIVCAAYSAGKVVGKREERERRRR